LVAVLALVRKRVFVDVVAGRVCQVALVRDAVAIAVLTCTICDVAHISGCIGLTIDLAGIEEVAVVTRICHAIAIRVNVVIEAGAGVTSVAYAIGIGILLIHATTAISASRGGVAVRIRETHAYDSRDACPEIGPIRDDRTVVDVV
jgi:hypothetical protein